VKQYYTLIQEFVPTNKRSLNEYLIEQGIEHEVGADFAEDFRKLGYNLPNMHPDELMSKCIVLIEEHELSAIMLSVDGVTIVDNRPFIDTKNKVRGWFKWFLN
jgi:hypothetical protein